MSAPIAVSVLTRDVIAQVREIAQALPYRSSVGVDPERVVWLDVAGEERIGVAYTPDDPDGPHWMIAFMRPDGRRVGKSAIGRVVDLIAGNGSGWEKAPPLDSAPHLTLVRVRAR
ncbi:MAG TPA: hypothetical protein VFV93_18150 [Thermomicrobiales bacterium]|nr:hypothetical protein [Thermomicrobiales bacterium]